MTDWNRYSKNHRNQRYGVSCLPLPPQEQPTEDNLSARSTPSAQYPTQILALIIQTSNPFYTHYQAMVCLIKAVRASRWDAYTHKEIKGGSRAGGQVIQLLAMF